MHHFDYRDDILHAEAVNLAALAEDLGTPFYCYSTATLERHYTVFEEALSKNLGQTESLICYALKANSNLAVIKTLANLGAGMDIVSEGELRRAIEAGVAPRKIVFSGVGKTTEEMAYALDQGILSFNVESEPELFALSEVAASRGQTADIAIRVNPDVDPKTHAKISTGKAQDKFGIPWEKAPDLFKQAASLPGLKVSGIHIHIGSQITDLQPFEDAFFLARELLGVLRSQGYQIDRLNLGGGLGIPYRQQNDLPPHPDDYAKVVKKTVGDLSCRLIFEPGRMLTGNAGILVARVIYVKSGDGKIFTIIDAAMNDLMRPTLYEAYHEIWPISEHLKSSPHEKMDVVGPICETGDFIARDRSLPPFKAGDLMAIMTAGAYGAVLSGTYNSRLLAAEILVKGGQAFVIRRRQTYDQLMGLEHWPDWLEKK